MRSAFIDPNDPTQIYLTNQQPNRSAGLDREEYYRSGYQRVSTEEPQQEASRGDAFSPTPIRVNRQICCLLEVPGHILCIAVASQDPKQEAPESQGYRVITVSA